VSFLLHEGVDKKRISRHLLIFSLAAPCLALVTYFGIGKVSKYKTKYEHMFKFYTYSNTESSIENMMYNELYTFEQALSKY